MERPISHRYIFFLNLSLKTGASSRPKLMFNPWRFDHKSVVIYEALRPRHP